MNTLDSGYADRLARREEARRKRFVDVQQPYRWNLWCLRLGRVLDVGCGVGRNMSALDPTSVGVDHNVHCIAYARERGFNAYSTQEFPASHESRKASFDSLLFAHVLEHVDPDTAGELLAEYLKYLRDDGKVVIITPQEAGFRTDETHVRFMDFAALRDLGARFHLREVAAYSFPFPRWAGRIFAYNEFVFVAQRGSATER